MTLVNIPDLADLTSADANDINSRFAAVSAVLNGHIDAQNLADGAVTSGKLASASVTSVKLAPTKSQDANGWTVYDYGTWKEYRRKWAVPGLLVSSGSRASAGTFNLPVGRTGSTTFISASWEGGFSGHAVIGIDVIGSSATSGEVNIGNEYSGGSLTFTGNVHFYATDA